MPQMSTWAEQAADVACSGAAAAGIDTGTSCNSAKYTANIDITYSENCGSSPLVYI